jgi:hypothetical protein
MRVIKIVRGLLIAAGCWAVGAGAASAQDAGAAYPGRTVLMSKCFQCHTDSMWRDQRQDRRAWEATLYRMVGRGALWSKDEIGQMADYLGSDFAAGKPAAGTPAQPSPR